MVARMSLLLAVFCVMFKLKNHEFVQSQVGKARQPTGPAAGGAARFVVSLDCFRRDVIGPISQPSQFLLTFHCV
jgi:hypothetical protein